jgi:hypothetical protein
MAYPEPKFRLYGIKEYVYAAFIRLWSQPPQENPHEFTMVPIWLEYNVNFGSGSAIIPITKSFILVVNIVISVIWLCLRGYSALIDLHP